MKQFALLGLALSLSLSAVAMAADVNMDVPYGDREPGGYQHLTVHYHNYWRNHHHPWSNIEAERHVVKEAQDLAKQTKIWEGDPRSTYVSASDATIRDRFNQYMFLNGNQTAFNPELPEWFVENVKTRASVDGATKDGLKLHQFLPNGMTYNDITYLPDEFTRK